MTTRFTVAVGDGAKAACGSLVSLPVLKPSVKDSVH